jgi:hypothetical protein
MKTTKMKELIELSGCAPSMRLWGINEKDHKK